MTVDEEVIESLHRDLAIELRALTQGEHEDQKALHFDASSIVPILAWQILVPFLIALTSKVAADRLTARRTKEKTASQLRTEALGLIGKPVKFCDPEELEESVILAHELLGPYGVSREGARKVVNVLAEKVSRRGKGTS